MTLNYTQLANNTASSWWKDPGMKRGMMHIFILYTVVYSLGYDGSLLNGLQALNPWVRDFDAPAGYDLGLISAAYYLPKIPGSFVIAYIADRWGRKYPLYIGGIFMLAGSLVGAFCHTRAELIGSRILLGIGTVTAQIGAASLIPELAHPRVRHMSGGFLNTCYYIGSILAAWITFGCVYMGTTSWAWRLPTLIQGLGPVLLLVGTWWVPQSPRWLVKNGRNEEAHKILATYHANGKMDDPLVMMEIKEIEAAVATESLIKGGSWMTFLNTPGGRRRLCIILMIGTASQWAGNGITSYYLVPVLKQVGISKPAQTAGINGGLAIWNWFIAMYGATSVERFGRRPLFLGSIIGMFVCFVCMMGVAGGYASTKVPSVGIAIIPFIFLFMGSYSFAFTPLPLLYTPEISGTHIRAKSVALLAFSQNTAQAFNQFVNPIALKVLTWKYYGVYVGVLGVYFILFWFFLRETKGLTVEEASCVYDPADKRDAAMEAERKLREAAEAALGDKSSKGSIEHIDSQEKA